MRLDRRSGVPLYLQIEERLRLGIAQGVWRVGDMLPPEAELCRMLGVSRGPVRQALGRLTLEGLIVRHRRLGTRVVRGLHAHGLILVSPHRAIQVAGLALTVKILALDVRPAPREVAARWRQAGRGDGRRPAAVYLERVFLGNEEPVAHARSWLPADRFERLLRYDLSQRPLLDILAQDFGIVITRLEETMEMTAMPASVAPFLGTKPGTPCLSLTLCQWSGRRPVEYATFSLSPAKSRFLITGLVGVESMLKPEELAKDGEAGVTP